MTPTIPVIERIIQNMVEALSKVQTPAYNNTITVVRPSPGTGNQIADRQVTVIRGPCVRDFDHEPEMTMQFLQTIYVLATAVESEQSTVSIDTRLATLEADVAKALTVDTTRGRLAEDTIIEVPHIEPAEPDAKTGSILCEFTVKYRTKYNAPYASVYDPD